MLPSTTSNDFKHHYGCIPQLTRALCHRNVLMQSDDISTCGCSVSRILCWLCWQGLELLTDFGLMASDSAGVAGI